MRTAQFNWKKSLKTKGMRIILFLLFIPLISFGQSNSDVLYEKALYEIRTSNKPAFASDIQFKSELSEDVKLDIIDTYLKKEGVFKVEFLSESKLRLYFFSPVSYEIIEDLARMFFVDYYVSKPIKIGLREGGLKEIE
jgi:hypothetical protein